MEINLQHMEKFSRFAVKAGHGSRQGGYCPFFKHASPYVGLDFVTHDPPKMPKIRVGIRYARRVKIVQVYGAGRVLY
jgi:hypothetical protein